MHHRISRMNRITATMVILSILSTLCDEPALLVLRSRPRRIHELQRDVDVECAIERAAQHVFLLVERRDEGVARAAESERRYDVGAPAERHTRGGDGGRH